MVMVNATSTLLKEFCSKQNLSSCRPRRINSWPHQIKQHPISVNTTSKILDICDSPLVLTLLAGPLLAMMVIRLPCQRRSQVCPCARLCPSLGLGCKCEPGILVMYNVGVTIWSEFCSLRLSLFQQPILPHNLEMTPQDGYSVSLFPRKGAPLQAGEGFCNACDPEFRKGS